jgi:DNA polymerase-3 subunit beta
MLVQYTLSEQTAGKFSIQAEEVVEYPTPQAVQAIDGVEPTEFRLPAAWLLKELTNARASVGNDEFRPVMGSVCLDADRKGMYLVSSDGHTLYSTRYEWGLGNPDGPFIRSGEPRRVLIDKQMFGAIGDAFSQDKEVVVRCDGNHVEVSGDGGSTINCVCCTMNYPNWHSVIPKDMPHRIVVEMRSLLSALRRVQPFADDASQMVRLAIEGQMLTVSAEDYDFNRSASENVPLQESTITGTLAIGMKSTSLMSMLQAAAKTENVVIELRDPSTAVLLKPEDVKDATTALVMPMLLNQ